MHVHQAAPKTMHGKKRRMKKTIKLNRSSHPL
jgi:hypothetical protein